MSFSADDIRRLLQLEPLPGEGGFFRETHRSAERTRTPAGERSAGTAIYYLLTHDIFSAMHRLPGDEIFHFYLGDPVDMLQLLPDGTSRTVTLGTDLAAGMRPQLVVPGGVWQGCRLRAGGKFALMGTTMSPGFDPRDFEVGKRGALITQYPSQRDAIMALTHA
ncbi:MAG TPA: cupin domain-containing protein [Candidatus Krumholzibacteria bacterium]|nr:cupin domain-containing protein [Candidatus Krumholzibacteria bacterium]